MRDKIPGRPRALMVYAGGLRNDRALLDHAAAGCPRFELRRE